MEVLVGIIAFFVVVCFLLMVILIPVSIAKKRGITGTELATISILSWLGAIIGITWIIALILALIWKPTKWVDKKEDCSNGYDEILKLHEMMEKKIITKKQFEQKRKELLGK